MAASSCSSDIAFTPPLCSTRISRGTSKTNNLKDRRLRLNHLVDGLATAATEGKMHLADGVAVHRMTRPVHVASSALRAFKSLVNFDGSNPL
jgi:hypothetical protein